MSATHHQVLGKCNNLEAREFTGENTLGCETLCFSPDSEAVGVLQVEEELHVCVLERACWRRCRAPLQGAAAGPQGRRVLLEGAAVRVVCALWSGPLNQPWLPVKVLPQSTLCAIKFPYVFSMVKSMVLLCCPSSLGPGWRIGLR